METSPSVRPRLVPALGNYLILLAATCAFAVQLLFDPGARYLDGMVLRRLSATGLFGYMWLHMTGIHLVGNLITLWIFGRYVCPRLGDMTYAVAYVVSGLGAAAVHLVYDGRPVIGASGAIMGILGLYVVISFSQFGRFGPWLILIWFLATVAAACIGGSPEAYVSHIGGFLTGMALGAYAVACPATVSTRPDAARLVLPQPVPLRP